MADRKPRRIDAHWIRSVILTSVLVGMIAIASDAEWLVAGVSIGISVVGFGFFSLAFARGAHFGMVVANFVAIYACLFEFFRNANFPLAPSGAAAIALATPVAAFLATCFLTRQSVQRAIQARRGRELMHLPRLSRWFFSAMAVGAASFAMQHLALDARGQGIALIAAMGIIAVLVAVSVHDVVLTMVDIAAVFELVSRRLDRLLMPMLAFLTFYALIASVFACFYRIADMTTTGPQFVVHGEVKRISFVDALHFSIVTLTTVGFGDISPASLLVRALSAIEVVCGILMLLFGFSEVMRNAGPDSTLHLQRRQIDSDSA
jgi:voltage-gated potassium channel